LTRIDDGEQSTGSKIPEHSSGSELFFSLLNNKQRINENETRTEQIVEQ
jgi:hypothetical protein